LATAQAGYPWTLTLNFYDETSGVLTDPTGTIQLDITYGSAVGLVSDVTGGGPFIYSGASSAAPNTIYRVSTGVYACQWIVPAASQTGVYVANWQVGYGANTFLVTEDFPVTGGYAPTQGVTDTGYWTGSLTYAAPYGTVSVPLGGVDSNGTAWLVKKLEGWDSPPAVGQVPQRSGDHGGWPTPQFYGPRVLTLTVMASAQSQALRDVARAQMQQVLPISDLATFVYNEPTPKQVSLRRNGGATVAETCPTLVDVEFKIPLICPDPRKYSTQTKTASVNATPTATYGVSIPASVPFTLPAQAPAGSVAVTNSGSFETRPLVTVTGPITGPTLTNVTSGQTVSYSQVILGSSDVLIVDMNARQGFFNGAFRAADITSSWWTLWPGSNAIQLGGSTNGGSAMRIAWSDAWI
jgi:hypothetical protein